MASITRYIGNLHDDCLVYNGTIWLDGYVSAGYPSPTWRQSGMIFRSISIPRNSTINTATITFTANGTVSATVCNTRFYCEDDPYPDMFSTLGDYNGRTLTSNYVDWDAMGTWTVDVDYDSPNLKTIVQEVVDRSDWEPGRPIAFYWKDNSSSSGARRGGYGFNDSTTTCPRITIDYTPPDSDYGVKISDAGYDVKTTTERYMTIMSTLTSHKVHMSGVISADTNVSHGLGFVPMWDAYIIDGSVTEGVNGYWNQQWYVSSDSTYLYCDEVWGTTSLFYIIYTERA